MKKIIILLISALMLSSCDFLDIVPDDTATLPDAFIDETKAEAFLFGCYGFQKGMNGGAGPNDFRYDIGIMTSNELVAAYHWTSQWFAFMKYNNGTDNSSTPVYDYWTQYYQGIRQCHIFLENIDNVVPKRTQPEDFEKSKKIWKGEAYFLLAYYHQFLLQHYGPVVLVDKVLEYNAELRPRQPIDVCVEQISAWYDQSMSMLPATQDVSNYGRVTTTIAKSMKAKLLLYAASPLFNGNTDYAEMKDMETNEALIPQTKNKEKWKTAMTAIKEAITYAEANGYHLYEWTGDDPLTKKPVADEFRQAYLNTRYLMVDPKNWESELIWGYTSKEKSDGLQRHAVPHGLGNRSNGQSSPVGALGPSLTAVELFYTANGLPPETDPSFPWEDRMAVDGDPATNTIRLHKNREPRFYAAIGYDRGVYEFNGWGTTEYTLKLRCGNGDSNTSLTGSGTNPEPNGCIGPDTKWKTNDHLYSGYALKKSIRPDGQATSSAWGFQVYAWPLMRLADLYLMYAEACAEYTGVLDADAKRYISLIHKRAGIPDQYHNATGEDLIKSVRRERLIEFMFEGQWYNDLRRWKIAEEWYENDKDGMWGLNDVGQTAETFYQRTQLKNQPFVFNKRNYLMPIKSTHLNTNTKLVQNTGY